MESEARLWLQELRDVLREHPVFAICTGLFYLVCSVGLLYSGELAQLMVQNGFTFTLQSIAGAFANLLG